MINSLCSKIIKSIKELTPAEDNKSNEIVERILSPENQQIEVIDKAPIEITIKESGYEYAHGKRFKTPPKWIVVHYTACANVSAKSMCKAMRKNNNASSHFYIDEKDIYSAVPLKYVAWHVAGGKVKQPIKNKELTLEELLMYKADDWRYDLAAKNHLEWQSNKDDFKGNYYSIGVDLCVKKVSLKTRKATDSDWYFEEPAIDNCAKLVAYLMKTYNINLEHVIRHGDATGKLCPTCFISSVYNPDGDVKWDMFKGKIGNYMSCDILIK